MFLHYLTFFISSQSISQKRSSLKKKIKSKEKCKPLSVTPTLVGKDSFLLGFYYLVKRTAHYFYSLASIQPLCSALLFQGHRLED